MSIMLPKTTHQMLYQSAARPRGVLVWAMRTFCAASVLYSLTVLGRQAGNVSQFPSFSLSASKPWVFELSRDEKDYSLSETQCNSAFPDLFRPITETLGIREKPMSREDTLSSEHWKHWVECRAMLYNNELYVIDDYPLEVYPWKEMNKRKFSTLHALNRAVIAGSAGGYKFPNIEFTLAYGDQNGDREFPNWAYDRKIEDNVTMIIPDFGLYSWPAHQVGTWSEVRDRTDEVQELQHFSAKIPKLFWRGTVSFGAELRESLVNASIGKPWSAVEGLEWLAEDFKDHMVTMPDHCKYQFLAHTEGLAYSGKLKYLHNCESVIIAHVPNYETHDQHFMIDSGPDQNFVQVQQDFSDLDEKMTWLLEHPSEAARIARNNVNTFRDRYLTPAAEACYWRKLIHEWAAHSAFEPEFFKVVDGQKVWRGVPFESFALMGSLEWNAQESG